MRRVACLCLLAGLLLVLTPGRADAYIGPGAGFAAGASFLAVFAAFFSAFALIVSWPARLAWRALFRPSDNHDSPSRRSRSARLLLCRHRPT